MAADESAGRGSGALKSLCTATRFIRTMVGWEASSPRDYSIGGDVVQKVGSESGSRFEVGNVMSMFIHCLKLSMATAKMWHDLLVEKP